MISVHFSEKRSANRARICLDQPRFLISTKKDGKLAAHYNYNHYNLPFSHIMIIVIISDDDMLGVHYIEYLGHGDSKIYINTKNLDQN